ncbi:MAG: metallophosphoesterase family protein [Pseudomonadota bacterium]
MPPIYAVGDIHGQLGQLEHVLALIDADGGGQVVFLGDYVDRGPDSCGVIQTLVDGVTAGQDWICLKGNHDRLMQWFLLDPPRHDPHLLIGFHWFHERIGGIETMQSYGLDLPEHIRLQDFSASAREVVPEPHIAFLENLSLSHETETLFFCHAGIAPSVPLAHQREEDLLWIRQPFHAVSEPHPKLIVHGHTPVDRATHYGNRVNLDAGAGYGRPLAAAVFDDGEVFELTDTGRVRMSPVIG